jgi:hypothetical protein
VINEDVALQGRDIIAEWINENIYVRKQLRRLYQELHCQHYSKAKRRRKAQSFINISIGQNH